MNESLKIALLTTHIPLSEVPKKVTIENLQKTIDIIDRDLVRTWKVRNPKIGILGLNPHAGEGGFLGSEEEEIIKPFIKSSKKDLYGPISADTAFISNNLKKYDLFLAMFHDQGLPVIKSMGFGNTLNITLGLPFTRISVDHGTAYEIAGKNKADFSSMEEALKKSVSLL
jgi:4-hydroxythreonine-4-phosphate dehydrogenase